MNSFNFFILYVLSCLWRISSGDEFLSSIAWDSWIHLEANDIRLLGSANFIDDFNECPDNCIQINKLENITASVVPAANAAEDPLNKFIGIEELDDSLYQKLVSTSTNKIVNTSDSRTVVDLLNHIVHDVRPILEEAIQKRLDILVDLKRERIDKALSQSLEEVNTILSTALSNAINIDGAWQTFLQKVRDSNFSDETKKALSYPVVKQQLTIAENKYNKGEKEKVAYYLEAIIPFLKEGLINEDDRIVDEQPHIIAKKELEEKVISEYKSLIEEAVFDAKRVDEFLDSVYNDGDESRSSSDLLKQIIDVEYIHDIRKAISIYLSFFRRKVFAEAPDSMAIEKYTNCENINQENVFYLISLIGTPPTWRHKLKIIKNPLCEAVGEKFRRRDIRSVPAIDRIFNLMSLEFEDAVQDTCKVYKKENDNFTKENASKLANILNNLLESKFKEIQKSDIDFLKTQLFKYDTYLRFDKDVFHVSENLQKFQEVMKTLAETSFNFTPGTFIYSESYFDVLEELCPVPCNSKENDIRIKKEL